MLFLICFNIYIQYYTSKKNTYLIIQKLQVTLSLYNFDLILSIYFQKQYYFYL